jgi:hypothetical protein
LKELLKLPHIFNARHVLIFFKMLDAMHGHHLDQDAEHNLWVYVGIVDQLHNVFEKILCALYVKVIVVDHVDPRLNCVGSSPLPAAAWYV